MGRLDNKIAIITGAGSGIGECMSKLFAKEGATVILNARRENTLQRVKAEIEAEGGKADYVAGDVSVIADCKKIIEYTTEKHGRIDILVNNAGITDQNRSTVNTSDEMWNSVVATNLSSVFYMCREVLKQMEKQKFGNIVNISSIGGSHCNSGAAYSATKAGVLSLTKNIAIQYSGTNIRCNATCPGPTPTAFNEPEKIAKFDQDFIAIIKRHTDMSVGESQQIDQANAALFLASDESRSITGQYFDIDRGMCL